MVRKSHILSAALLSFLLASPVSAHGGRSMGTGSGYAGEGGALFTAIISLSITFLILGSFIVVHFLSKYGKPTGCTRIFTSLAHMLKNRWYPTLLVLPATIVFFIILFQLFYGSAEASYNFGSVMVWVLFWPLLPVLFLLSGRLWCSVCPMSGISDEVQKMVGLNKKVPRILQEYGIWFTIAAFAVITWSDVAFGLVESPRNTGFLLLFILSGVALTGAVFERRAWCRYLCFMGGLSGNYSMCSAIGLRADSGKCSDCKTPSCYKGSGNAGGCPMFEYPRTMDSSRFCNFCANCIKSCKHDAIRIAPRVPTAELWSIRNPRFEDSFLAVALIGIVMIQTAVMLEAWMPFMERFKDITSVTDHAAAWTLVFIIAMLIPLLLALGAGYTQGRHGPKIVLSNFISFGYSFIPLGLGIHLAHNANHFFGEGLSAVYVPASLLGLDASGGLAILDANTIQVVQYVLTMLGMLGAVCTAVRISWKYPDHRAVLSPYILLIIIFGVVSLWMFTVPMAARVHVIP